MTDAHLTTQPTEGLSEHEIIAQRRAKLAELRKDNLAFRNDFKRDALAMQLHQTFDHESTETIAEKHAIVAIAGRMMTRRLMGKASFATLQDMSGRIQVYIKSDDINDETYHAFKHWDLGDIIGVRGFLFKTKTGELSVHASEIYLLTKALRPLPDKYHGLTSQEQCYRKRYLDLMTNEHTRQTFMVRSKTVACIRQYLENLAFMEVETPMMQPIPGGATAKPFVTHHNALDMALYLRIAPELYLKRLVVGGFEKVFEINRNFRNEGLSTRHNPEFTMLEFYQAYATYHDLMDLTEDLLRHLTQTVLGQTKVTYQGMQFDFAKTFARMTMVEAIAHYVDDISLADLQQLTSLRTYLQKHNITIPGDDINSIGKMQLAIFEALVETKLIEPTFITAYPTVVSPLARCNDQDASLTDRFELFIAGREIANGFSELNDPEDQAARFQSQVQNFEAGDEEAMHYDADYITALEYGLPPTAGEGIGIDRLVMLLTDSASIRDVILFPHMRPE